ncbi:hypothetical protein HY501_01055 [Candidatus Woesearchaeota archaeon]|nr:hypothetical protein [Candidatus Woesearchaeota archaeon]
MAKDSVSRDEMMMDRMEAWIKKNWGRRCDEYEPTCHLCNAWKYFDFLFEFVKEDREEKKLARKKKRR